VKGIHVLGSLGMRWVCRLVSY